MQELRSHYQLVRERLWPKGKREDLSSEKWQRFYVRPTTVAVRVKKELPPLPTIARPISIYPYAIGPVLREERPWLYEVSASAIMAEECRAHGVTREQIVSHARPVHITRARQVVMARLHEELCWSLTRVGRYVDKDHTTVLHAVKKYRAERGKA